MKTSVALCTYNGQLYLSEQLESILLQTINVDEIVVCDDSSNDDTWKILQQYQKKYPEIFRIFRNENALGIIGNFEKAINLCTGDVVFLSDQDDIWFKEKVENILDYFQKNPTDKAVFHNLLLYTENKPLEKTLWDVIEFNEAHRRKDILLKHILLFDNVITGAAFAFKKTGNFKIEKIEQELHDYYLALYFLGKKQLGVYNRCLGYYRLHSAQNVGASAETTDYQKKIHKMQNAYYKEENLVNKLKILEHGQQKLENLKSFSQIYTSLSEDLKSEIITTRNKFLQQQHFIERKKIIASWWMKKKHHIQFLDLFKL